MMAAIKAKYRVRGSLFAIRHSPFSLPLTPMHRRQFIQHAGLFTASSLVAVGGHGWFARTNAQTATPKRLIVVFL